MKHSERGSAILMLFVLVALFGILTFVFLRSTDSNVSWLQKEESNATATASQDCANAVTMAVKRLQLRGCGTKISYDSDGSNSNAGAPPDGSCSVFHTNGGGVKPCNNAAVTPNCTTAQLGALTIGQSCGDSIYAGVSGGNRIYVAKADAGSFAWAAGTLPTAYRTLPASDGLANTNAILAYNDGFTYPAAQACHALGANWYLPASDEVGLMATNYNVGEFNGTYDIGTGYWTSDENGDYNAIQQFDMSNQYGQNDRTKTTVLKVRCVHR